MYYQHRARMIPRYGKGYGIWPTLIGFSGFSGYISCSWPSTVNMPIISLWKEGLIVRLMHRRIQASHLQIRTPCPHRGIKQLTMYLVADMLLNGRRLRRLTIVDNRRLHRSQMRSIPPGSKVIAALELVGTRN